MLALDKKAIQQRIPHRGDALFLLEAEINDDGICGVACWPHDHAYLAGHFPGLPIVPGVCLIEAAAQLAGVSVVERSAGMEGEYLGMLAGVKKVLVHNPVYANESVNLSLKIGAIVGGKMVTVQGVGRKDDNTKVLTASLTIAIVKLDE